MASPTTPAAGMVAESVRSRSASAGSCVARSTERSGLVSVGSGFIAAAHDDRLARGHAALEAPGVVGLAVEAALVAEEDLVVGARARAPGDVEGVADARALDRLDRAQRAGQAAVEPPLPARVRAQAGRGAEGDDLEDAAQRLVRLALDVDVLDHRVARVAVQAAHGIVVDALEVLARAAARRAPAPAPSRSAPRASGPRPRARAGRPWPARRRPPARRSRARSRARARCARRSGGTSRCRRGRRDRGAAGGPRPPRPPPATGSSAPPSWRSRGWRPAGRSARRACARGAPRR